MRASPGRRMTKEQALCLTDEREERRRRSAESGGEHFYAIYSSSQEPKAQSFSRVLSSKPPSDTLLPPPSPLFIKPAQYHRSFSAHFRETSDSPSVPWTFFSFFLCLSSNLDKGGLSFCVHSTRLFEGAKAKARKKQPFHLH